MAYTAAAMYGGAAFVALIEGLIPGGPSYSPVPGLAALVVVTLLLAAGPRLPRWGLAPLGPIGACLIADALTTSPGPGDGAILYLWPVLWTAFFFGRRGAVAIVACVGVAHGIALISLPAASGFADRWVDVMVSVSVAALVVQVLASRNDELLTRLAGEARTDALTGLLNRRGFQEHAAPELAHARREGHSIGLASFDVDYFKRVNDEWGHETGDRVLARLGALLTSHARDVDVVARIGGEEFVVLLPGTDSAEAAAFTERIRRALATSGDTALPTVRVSAGVAAEVAPENVGGLLQRADSALYAAKRGGRNVTYEAGAADLTVAHASPERGKPHVQGDPPNRLARGDLDRSTLRR
jgi:diguanylate cyclase (GGDEF)-like protein